MLTQVAPDMETVPGGWIPDTSAIQFAGNSDPWFQHSPTHVVIKDALWPFEVKALRDLFDSAPHQAPVGGQGKQDCTEVGSVRTTMWAPKLADQLTMKFIDFLPTVKATPFTATDWWQTKGNQYHTWIPYAVSPMLRFMRYESGGQHFPHYDAGFIYPNEEYRTLKSFVLYLTTCSEETGGATRIIKDGQESKFVWDRNHDDWDRNPTEEEIVDRVYPEAGSVMLFNHRQCHDVESYFGKGPRIIVRGDIIYKAMTWHT